MLLIFRTRGVRVFCVVAGLFRPKYTWLLHALYMPVKKNMWWTHGDFHMYGYISHLAIFCRLALDLGHQILALELEFAAVDLRGVDSLTGHLFALSFSCIFLFIQLHCLYCERNLFHCIEIQKIVLYKLVVLYWLCIKFTDSICIQKFVMYIREAKNIKSLQLYMHEVFL